MMATTARRRPAVVTLITVLIVGETVTFLLASLLHLGVPIPLGFTQPQLIAAAIVEGLIWLFLSVSLYAMFAHRTWAWGVTLAAHIFSVAGVGVGIFETSRSGAGGEPNFVYHRVIMVALIVVLALLATPAARATLGHGRLASPMKE